MSSKTKSKNVKSAKEETPTESSENGESLAKTRKKKISGNFSTYINKVLKQVHPDTGITGDSTAILNNLLLIIIKKIMHSVNVLFQNSNIKKQTLGSRDILFAVNLTFPGELRKNAVSEGTKAVTKYGESLETQSNSERVTKSYRAGLQFSVSRVQNFMLKHATMERKSAGAAVFLAGVIEYFCAEILELAGNAARDNKRSRIKPRHILLAVGGDEELGQLCDNTFFGGGVVPFIHSQLVKSSHKKTATKKSTQKTKKKKSKK